MYKKLVPLIILIIVVFVVISYYSYPISIQRVIESYKSIERIDVDYLSEGEVKSYIVHFDQATHFKDLISILDSTSYTHEYRGKYKGTFNRVMKITTFYRNANNEFDNFSIELTEDGELLIKNKLYQMNKRENEIFNQLYDWIINKGEQMNS